MTHRDGPRCRWAGRTTVSLGGPDYGAARRGRPTAGPTQGEPLDQVVQAEPFTVNAVGTASLLVQVPWKPSEVLPPGAIVPL
jgi:hypothetical protein